MSAKIALIALAVAFTMPLAADTPNIQPGMWETTSTVTIDSAQFQIPPRTDTTSECVTEERIADGMAFLNDSEECEYTRQDVRSDGMDYTMVCSSPDGGTVTMNATMQFNGDSMTGTIDGDIESPMGLMAMNVEMEGRRTGDC
ncbi:MAG: DUF3617 domain-containing protein [Wenzhouxiangellaceae bacterium]